MPWDTDLHGVHLAIAAYVGTPLRVVAGPGTGKTYALMRRVARRIYSKIVESVLKFPAAANSREQSDD
jgi:hypothetical protein